MLSILSVFVNKCKAAGRYGEGNCLFNAKCIIGFLCSLNILTILELIVRSECLVAILPHGKTTFITIGLIFTTIVFMILTLKYPKKKVLEVNLAQKSKNQIFIGLVSYMIVSLAAFSLALMKR